MPTERASISLADQRTLRFAVGTSATLAFSQALAWQHSYLAAVFAAMFLTLPLPPPKLRGGMIFLLILAGALLLGLMLLGPLKHYEFAGLMLLAVSFFAVFRYSLSGGNPLVTSLAIAGLAALPIVGVLSIPAAFEICQSLMKAGLVALAAMWLFHALFPDPPALGPTPTPAAPAALPLPPARLAARSTLVVMPVLVWLLATSGTSNIAVAIKVSSMGQQASADSSRQAGLALLFSTLIGGLAAVALWLVLKVWPSLLLYSLLILLAGLMLGRRIFAPPGNGLPGPVWSYGFVTMLIILGPIVLDSGDAAGGRFFDRLLMFGGATVYSVLAVLFFDVIMGHRPAAAPERRTDREADRV
jgi:hypothetical protein